MAEYYFDVLDEAGQVSEEVPVAGPETIGRSSAEYNPGIEIPAACRSASRQQATLQLQGNQLVLADHSRYGTIVNRTLIQGRSVPLRHGDEIIFGLPGDGWRVRFRAAKIPGGTTKPADALELLIVSEAPRQIRIGRQVVEEHLGDLAFRLLKFLCDDKGSWYTTGYLISFLWPDADGSPLQANQALARRKKQINDLISPCINGEKAIESYPHRGYRLRPRLEE